MDVIFFIFVPASWMAYEENNTVWNNLRSLHGFAIFLSVVIFILKVPPPSRRSPCSTWYSSTRDNYRPNEWTDKLTCDISEPIILMLLVELIKR